MSTSADQVFTRFSTMVAKFAGHPMTFCGAVLFVVIWALTGGLFHYSDTWQLVINTSTTIVSFWMVFLIQNTQNRDSLALHLKLDQVILSIESADNQYINLEALSAKDLEDLTAKICRELDKKKTNKPSIA